MISYIFIATPPNKTTYFVGEFFDPTGMVVKAHYTNGTNQIINMYTFGPNTQLTTDDHEITIMYQLFSVKQTINVIPALIVDSYPNKLNYHVGSIGDHIIARDDFSDWRILVDISLSAGFGALSGVLGGEGAMYGVDLNSAASAIAKSSLAYSKVVSRATQRGYATARGMSIALSRTGNSLARAISNYYFLTCKVSTNLVKSLAASAFSNLGYSFIGGLFDFEW